MLVVVDDIVSVNLNGYVMIVVIVNDSGLIISIVIM